MVTQLTRTRMSATDRRKQLIGIGLQLLAARPIHDLSIDEVAANAGISRGLLFHYFPTKHDYYVAVVHAAGQRLLKHAQAPAEGTPAQRIEAILHGFVGFVQRRRANYVALVRGNAGGDAQVIEVFDELRDTLTHRSLDALNISEAVPLARLAVRGWLAMAEEMAIGDTDGIVNAQDLVKLLLENLGRTLHQIIGDDRGLAS